MMFEESQKDSEYWFELQAIRKDAGCELVDTEIFILKLSSFTNMSGKNYSQRRYLHNLPLLVIVYDLITH